MNDKKEIEERILKIIRKFADKNPCGEGQIRLINRRYVLLSTDYFPFDLTKDLEEMFNAAGDAVLYRGGEKIGKELYEHYLLIARKYGIDIWDVISAVGWYFGWGTGEVVERGEKNGKYRIKVYDSFEADSFIRRVERTEKPVCHFMKGVLNGIVEGVEGRKYRSEEKMCKAMGGEYCEFVLQPMR